MTKRTYNSDRINALSDGVFAIAMTLLIFNIQISDLGEVESEAAFKAALIEQLPHIVSWLLSFAILCRLWLTHNYLMHDRPSKSVEFTTCNFVLLGAVAFIPFPASLLGEYPDQPWSVIVLSCSYAGAAFAMAGMWYNAPDRHNAKARQVLTVSMLMLFACALSCLLTLVHAYLGIAVWMLYLLGVVPTRHYVDRVRADRAGLEQAQDK